MSMAVFWVVYVGIDAPLKDGDVVGRLRGLLPCCFVQLNVQECGNMTEVEDAGVAKLDGLVVELFVRKHAPGDNIPGTPESAPLVQSGQRGGGVYRRCEAEGHSWFDEQV